MSASETGRPRQISLGYPLDELLRGKEKEDRPGDGILLPDRRRREPGTGNIIITGAPGSGKSTLALQIAVYCTLEPNRMVSAYLSLENTPEEIEKKANDYGWGGRICLLEQRGGSGPLPAETKPADRLRAELERFGMVDGKLKPCVLLPQLSPRPLGPGGDEKTLFWRRYEQLEKLLRAGHELRRTEDPATSGVLPLVVVDSLNMFASTEEYSRDNIYQLFSLFDKYETVGVLTVESTQDTPFDSTMADVVIRLTSGKDGGHFFRYIEVEKSRFRRPVYGPHPFRTEPFDPSKSAPPDHVPTEAQTTPPRSGVVIFPSLHYLVSATADRTGPDPQVRWDLDPPDDRNKEGPSWGVAGLSEVLPSPFLRGSILTLEGPRATFKTPLVLSFLAMGLIQGENVMLIRIHDSPLFRRPRGKTGVIEAGPLLSRDVIDAAGRPVDTAGRRIGGAFVPKTSDEFWSMCKFIERDQKSWEDVTRTQKADITVWRYRNPPAEGDPKRDEPASRMLELNFKTGALLPEELVHIVKVVLDQHRGENHAPISRVVLDDVSEIGTSYPLLRRSKVAEEIFLPAFAHLMRNYGVDLAITGTTGDLAEANEAVYRACNVADAVVSCQFADIFGRRHVILQGEGLVARHHGPESTSKASVPPVIRALVHPVKGGRKSFRVDARYLEGLIGFETGDVHRPGLALYVFEENTGNHRRYNREMEIMLQAAFGLGPRTDANARLPRAGELAPPAPRRRRESAPAPLDEAPRVGVFPFGPRTSEALHDAFRVFRRGEPFDKTILCTVDEFWDSFDEESSAGGNGPNAPDEDQTGFVGLRIEVDPPRGDEVEVGSLSVSRLVEVLQRNYKFRRDEKGSKHIYRPVWPYYLNVMLLAYRTDLLKKVDCWSDWEKLYRYCGAIQVQPDSNEQAATASIWRPFWCDQSADETLSCALMDVLTVALGDERLKALFDTEKEQLMNRDEKQKIATQVGALHRLLRLTGSPVGTRPDTDIGEEMLPADAAVYLCWYSQLRELIDRAPHLATKLKVCALPGRGFRGDWFIGIKSGSVSTELGRAVLEKLCSKEEQYKRFAKGVGLPVDRDFYEKNRYLAWSRSDSHELEAVFQIHKEARSRRDIYQYARFRAALAHRADQLTGKWDSLNDEQIVELVEGLIEQIKHLKESLRSAPARRV